MTETARTVAAPRGSAVPATARAWWSALRLGVQDAYRVYHPPAGKPGRTPQQKGLVAEPVHVVTSRDRVRLDGWFVPGDGPHTVVVCHGMGRTKNAVLDHVKLLHEAGHHVLAYDLRNHGASGHDGKVTRMADRFTGDLRDVLRFVAADPRMNRGKLAVLAFSFSTWPAVYALQGGGPPVAAIVCDSGPMHDIPGGFRHFTSLRRASLPEPLRRPGAFALYRKAFTLCGTRMLAVRGWPPPLPSVATRMLFIGGANDPVVPASQVMRVAAEYPAARRWVAPQAQHINAVRLDRDEYRERVTAFLAEAFGGAA
ncbi:alpha/beta hydrolase [Saccharothrix algeriensis]|uniref:Alpha-beta hydrolase superfamily lysophospholipase n=1 Tax=Saccharothrix algeriensis TaxID=173560 RepID=A0A8T8I0T2_9PSEU|nr:alpha/beta fold hydrolase [Saccharothrix algeriensis]MBM7810375.1 alpha-beta hydrolase superfamily lysophospholipase [Saccharothrix algeriensis]QTR04513.1 alpha/beta fold hydrolase [Saccharothrix algeriensis]